MAAKSERAIWAQRLGEAAASKRQSKVWSVDRIHDLWCRVSGMGWPIDPEMNGVNRHRSHGRLPTTIFYSSDNLSAIEAPPLWLWSTNSLRAH